MTAGGGGRPKKTTNRARGEEGAVTESQGRSHPVRGGRSSRTRPGGSGWAGARQRTRLRRRRLRRHRLRRGACRPPPGRARAGRTPASRSPAGRARGCAAGAGRAAGRGARAGRLLEADATDPASLAALAAQHPGGGHDRRSVRAVRAAAGRGVRPGRHALRRPHRRGAVRARRHRPRRRGRPGERRPDRARLRLRLDPVGPGRSCWPSGRAADGAGGLRDVRLVATPAAGFSGGTIDSMRAQVDAMQQDPSPRRLVGDPFALSPDRAAEPDTRAAARRRTPRTDRRRPVDGPVRHGAVQHPDRAAQQRPAGLGVRPRSSATAR